MCLEHMKCNISLLNLTVNRSGIVRCFKNLRKGSYAIIVNEIFHETKVDVL